MAPDNPSTSAAPRTVPGPIRRALICRDEACAFPGCDRHAAWTQAHHITHWADGGTTKLNNLVHRQAARGVARA